MSIIAAHRIAFLSINALVVASALAVGWAIGGECLRALGRIDEALQAYSQSARLAPRSPFGKRAQAQLQSMSRQPYR